MFSLGFVLVCFFVRFFGFGADCICVDMHMFAEYVYDVNEFCVGSCQFTLCKCVCKCSCIKCEY